MTSKKEDSESGDTTWWSNCNRCEAPVLKQRYSVPGWMGRKWFMTYSCEQCGLYSHVRD